MLISIMIYHKYVTGERQKNRKEKMNHHQSIVAVSAKYRFYCRQVVTVKFQSKTKVTYKRVLFKNVCQRFMFRRKHIEP